MNYANLAKTAKRLLGSNGTKCILVVQSGIPPVYNPATNTYDSSDPRYEGVCVITGYDDKLIDGTVIKAGDVKVMAVLPEEPKPGLSSIEVYDKAGRLKDVYSIINSNPVNPNASEIILIKLQCRK